VGRSPIASCDFSTHPYSYDDVDGDLNLTSFALTKEDYTFKVGRTKHKVFGERGIFHRPPYLRP
jgi:hypothetical protein